LKLARGDQPEDADGTDIGRRAVMESSASNLEGWLVGYLLTGRMGPQQPMSLRHIIDSM